MFIKNLFSLGCDKEITLDEIQKLAREIDPFKVVDIMALTIDRVLVSVLHDMRNRIKNLKFVSCWSTSSKEEKDRIRESILIGCRLNKTELDDINKLVIGINIIVLEYRVCTSLLMVQDDASMNVINLYQDLMTGGFIRDRYDQLCIELGVPDDHYDDYLEILAVLRETLSGVKTAIDNFIMVYRMIENMK